MWVALCAALTGCTFDKSALGPWAQDAFPDADSAPDVSVPDGGVHDTLGHDTGRDTIATDTLQSDTLQSDVLQQDTLVQQDVLPQTDAPPYAQCTGMEMEFSTQKLAQISDCEQFKVDGQHPEFTPVTEVIIIPGGVCTVICHDKAGGGRTVLPDKCRGLWSAPYTYAPWTQTGCRQLPANVGQTPDQSGCDWLPDCTVF